MVKGTLPTTAIIVAVAIILASIIFSLRLFEQIIQKKEVTLDSLVETTAIELNATLPQVVNKQFFEEEILLANVVNAKDLRTLMWVPIGSEYIERIDVLAIYAESYNEDLVKSALKNIIEEGFGYGWKGGVPPAETIKVDAEVVIVYRGKGFMGYDETVVYAWEHDKFGFVVAEFSSQPVYLNSLAEKIIASYK